MPRWVGGWLDARKAASGGRRRLFVESGLRRLRERGRAVATAVLLGGLGLELRHPLGRHLVGVLLLDPAQPRGALGGLAGLELGGAAFERTVDFDKELVDEPVLGHLPQRLALGEDQARVPGARD